MFEAGVVPELQGECAEFLTNQWTTRLNKNGLHPHGGWDRAVEHLIRIPVDADAPRLKRVDVVKLAEALIKRLNLEEEVGEVAAVLSSMSPAGAFAVATLQVKSNLDWRQPSRFPFDASVRPNDLGVSLKNVTAIRFEPFSVSDKYEPIKAFEILDHLNDSTIRMAMRLTGEATIRLTDDDGRPLSRQKQFGLDGDTLQFLMNSDPELPRKMISGAAGFMKRASARANTFKRRFEPSPLPFADYAGGADW